MIVSWLAVLLLPAFSCFYKDVRGTILFSPGVIILPHTRALLLPARLAAEAVSIWTGCSDARHQLNLARLSSHFAAYWPLILFRLIQRFEWNCSRITRHWPKWELTTKKAIQMRTHFSWERLSMFAFWESCVLGPDNLIITPDTQNSLKLHPKEIVKSLSVQLFCFSNPHSFNFSN